MEEKMENADEIRKKIARLIIERGLNYAQVSMALGKNIAYLQQYIKNGSPRRLGEVERHKLSQILQVDEQELTDGYTEDSEEDEDLYEDIDDAELDDEDPEIMLDEEIDEEMLDDEGLGDDFE